MNDFILFTIAGIGALVSGVLYQEYGWSTLMMVVGVLMGANVLQFLVVVLLQVDVSGSEKQKGGKLLDVLSAANSIQNSRQNSRQSSRAPSVDFGHNAHTPFYNNHSSPRSNLPVGVSSPHQDISPIGVRRTDSTARLGAKGSHNHISLYHLKLPTYNYTCPHSNAESEFSKEGAHTFRNFIRYLVA